MSISAQIPDNIKRVSKILGYTLWLDHADDWFGLSVVLRARLSDHQRTALAYMALRSLDHDQAVLAAENVLTDGAGQPMSSLFNHMEGAAFWADMASPDELDAYALASFKRMAPQRQNAFLDYVQGRAAA